MTILKIKHQTIEYKLCPNKIFTEKFKTFIETWLEYWKETWVYLDKNHKKVGVWRITKDWFEKYYLLNITR